MPLGSLDAERATGTSAAAPKSTSSQPVREHGRDAGCYSQEAQGSSPRHWDSKTHHWPAKLSQSASESMPSSLAFQPSLPPQ